MTLDERLESDSVYLAIRDKFRASLSEIQDGGETNKYKRWTVAEVELLTSLYRSKATMPKIERALGRSYDAIRFKIDQLGLARAA